MLSIANAVTSSETKSKKFYNGIVARFVKEENPGYTLGEPKITMATEKLDFAS